MSHRNESTLGSSMIPLGKCLLAALCALIWFCAAPNAFCQPTHVILMFVDHWEPNMNADGMKHTRLWRDEYFEMASRHRDADGVMPQHTWFCANLNEEQLGIISEAVYLGLGEIEIHIHHGSADDTGKDNTKSMAAELDKYISALRNRGGLYSISANLFT
jgi:hypothetical protein